MHGDQLQNYIIIDIHLKFVEHLVDKCPQKLFGVVSNQTSTSHQGRVFATNRKEAEKASTMVTGTLPILGDLALVLFDSGLFSI